MALTTVAELRSTLGVGTLYPDATLQEVCDATDVVLLPMLWNPTEFAVANSNTVGEGTLYFDIPIDHIFYVGQSVTISNCGTKYNGSKTITSVNGYSFNVATAHTVAQPRSPFAPFGTVTTETYTNWTSDTAVQQAALMIAVDIWQARTATLSGSNLVDFQPSPYRMSAQLLAKVRGLIAHALDPRSMAG